MPNSSWGGNHVKLTVLPFEGECLWKGEKNAV